MNEHGEKPDMAGTTSAKKGITKYLLPILDLVYAPWVYLAAILLKRIRGLGVRNMPICKNALLTVGVFPIRDHYYEPFFSGKALRYPLSKNRDLPGIDWNVREQLELLDSFDFNEEMRDLRATQKSKTGYCMTNMFFGPGDTEYLYNFLRLTKPSRIFEIGSGYSTLLAIRAMTRSGEEDAGYKCEHVCIEPNEAPWLEHSGVKVIRKKVEELDKEFFSELGRNDILFIDSSHVIRPQGDVLFEYLELLPFLKAGVVVHAHDIFSPRDYPHEWLIDHARLWTEQYLLEAFLTSNKDWKIIGALNYLHHNHYDRLLAKCPYLSPEREPGSFYIQKIA